MDPFWMRRYLPIAGLTLVGLITAAGTIAAGEDTTASTGAVRQQLNDAWWTGPMLAPSANTLPRGHILIEPYLFDVISQGSYDSHGVRRSSPHANGFGSLTYLLF